MSVPTKKPNPPSAPRTAQRSVAARATYTTNQQIVDDLLTYQARLLQYSNSLNTELRNLLNASEFDIMDRILSRLSKSQGLASPSDWNRLNNLMERIRSDRTGAWQNVANTWANNLNELAVSDPAITAQIISNASVMELRMVLPAPRLLKAIIRERPFQGRLLKQWIDKLASDDVARIQGAIQMGMTQGETAKQIATRVVGTKSTNGANGVLQITRNQLESIVRTSVQAVANSAREEMLKENIDVIQGEQFVATLDARTTITCGSLDGKIFPVSEGPIPPLHFNCRSLRVAVVDGEVLADRPFKSSTEGELVKEYTDANNLDAVSSRDALPRGHKGRFDKFTRRRVRELTGQVPAQTNYNDWFARQTREFQEEAIGKTRTQLFRDGKLTLDKFVDRDATPLTLPELRAKYPEAFSN